MHTPHTTGPNSVCGGSAKPVYLKLRDKICAAIIDGLYPEGALLPSVRALAAREGANPLTVAKAYQQFQNDGLVIVQRGVGLMVAPGAAALLAQSERAFSSMRSGPRSVCGCADWDWKACLQMKICLSEALAFPRIAQSLEVWHLYGTYTDCVATGLPAMPAVSSQG